MGGKAACEGVSGEGTPASLPWPRSRDQHAAAASRRPATASGASLRAPPRLFTSGGSRRTRCCACRAADMLLVACPAAGQAIAAWRRRESAKGAQQHSAVVQAAVQWLVMQGRRERCRECDALPHRRPSWRRCARRRSANSPPAAVHSSPPSARLNRGLTIQQARLEA